jgi:hypothetical protein
VLAAGGTQEGGYWVRTVSPMDARSRVLLEGDQVGGRPVDGVVTPDGGRFRLLLAQPDAAEPSATRWQLIDVDTADGTRRDTGITGIVPVPSEELRADFADDAGSLVLWGTTGTTAATLVDIGDGRQTPVPAQERPSVTVGFRAFPSGAAQLWGDGAVSLVDRGGTLVQVLDAHGASVRDIVVSRDDTWAVTAGDGAEVTRWDVDPSTGRWSDPQPLAGHAGDVVGVEADPAGRTVVTVSLDHTVISWDMSHDGDRADGRPADPEAWLREVCAVAGRDLDPTEWRRFLPGSPWRPTCSDLP